MIWVRGFRKAALGGVLLSGILFVVWMVRLLTGTHLSHVVGGTYSSVQKVEMIALEVLEPFLKAAPLFFSSAGLFVLCEIALGLNSTPDGESGE